MDQSLFRWINGWPDAPTPLFVFLSEATKSPFGKAIFAILAFAFLFAGPKARKALLLGIVAVLLANETTDILKHTLPTLRPCVELADIHLRVGFLDSPGTASAHSANMAALASVFVLVWGWRGTFWVPIAILTGISRIFVGVHYPSQVLLGWTCGAFAALVVVKTWEAWTKWRTLEASPETAPDQHSAGDG